MAKLSSLSSAWSRGVTSPEHDSTRGSARGSPDSDEPRPRRAHAEDQARDPFEAQELRDARRHHERTVMTKLREAGCLGAPASSSSSAVTHGGRRLSTIAAAEQRVSLGLRGLEERLLRFAGEPHVVWVLGDDSHGQGGRSGAEANEPMPAGLRHGVLKGGAKSVHAGGFCTFVIDREAHHQISNRRMHLTISHPSNAADPLGALEPLPRSGVSAQSSSPPAPSPCSTSMKALHPLASEHRTL